MRRLALQFAWIVAVGLLYFVAGRFGLWVVSYAVPVNPSASPVWPASGLAIAAAVLIGPAVWPAIFTAAFFVNVTTDASPMASLLIATGNTLEAAVAAILMRRYTGGRHTFDRAGDILQFIFLVAIPACLISSTFGLSALLEDGKATREHAALIWLTWWLGDFIGAVTVTPLILVWATRRFAPRGRGRNFEAVLVVLVAAAIAHFAFGNPIIDRPAVRPLTFLVLPTFIWAAYRFHQHGATMLSLIFSVLAISGTIRELGPFANFNTHTALTLLQGYLGVVTVTALVLAASLNERSRVEIALRNAEARNRAIFDTAVDGVITIDERGTVEQINPAVERLFGFSSAEIIGQNIRMLMPPAFSDEHDSYLSNFIRTGERKIIGSGREVQGRRKDGSVFPIDLSVSELHLDDRRIFTGIIHDISEHKRVSQEREDLLESERRARDEAERASRAKDQFIAVLSHELRTPLTPVLLTVASLEEDPTLSADQREQITLMRRNVELEARLIDDLLDLTRVARGKLQLRLWPHDLHDIIQSAIRVCGEDKETAAHGAGANTAAPARTIVRFEADQHHVSADPGRMQQVFWNLLSNAQKFTPADGQITITTLNSKDDQTGAPTIVVAVTDTGVGIDPPMLSKLFNAFEQGEAGQTVRRSGLGLGLAICKALVMAHGGTIEARSDGPGAGSTFIVSLPTVAPIGPEEQTQGNAGRVSSPRRILLVEDDAMTLKVLRKLLETRHHDVTTASSVSTALDAAHRAETSDRRFDLVISDLGLPDGTGDELMRQLKERFNLKGIALSGYGMESDIRRSLDAGFTEHLTKPIDLPSLESAMSRVLTA